MQRTFRNAYKIYLNCCITLKVALLTLARVENIFQLFLTPYIVSTE